MDRILASACFNVLWSTSALLSPLASPTSPSSLALALVLTSARKMITHARAIQTSSESHVAQPPFKRCRMAIMLASIVDVVTPRFLKVSSNCWRDIMHDAKSKKEKAKPQDTLLPRPPSSCWSRAKAIALEYIGVNRTANEMSPVHNIGVTAPNINKSMPCHSPKL